MNSVNNYGKNLKNLISFETFKQLKSHAKIIDASYCIPKLTGNREFKKEFYKYGLTNDEIYLDMNKFTNKNSDFKNTIPDYQIFNNFNLLNNISKNDLIIIYDRTKQFIASSRAWWIYKGYGFDNVKVLNDDVSDNFIDKSQSEYDYDQKLNDFTKYTKKIGDYSVKDYYHKYLIKKSEVKDDLLVKRTGGWPAELNKSLFLIDARSSLRYIEGYIPYSYNLPYTDIITEGKIDESKVKDYLKKYNLDHQDNVGFTCNSGITACTLALAFNDIACIDPKVYDGSMDEWIYTERVSQDRE